MFLAVMCQVIAIPMVADQPLGVDQVVRRAEVVVSTGARSPHLLKECLVDLRDLIDASEGEAPIGLLRRLSAQLEAVSAQQEALSEERRLELLRAAGLTVDLLKRKLTDRRSVATAASVSASSPGNDDCESAEPLSGSVSGTTSGATVDGVASCGNSTSSPDVWYSYTASHDGLVVWETTTSLSLLDTVLSLHSACPDASASHELTCNDDARGTLGSQVARELSAGETVLLRVSGASGASGEFLLAVDVDGGGIGGSVRKAGTGEPRTNANLSLYDSSGTPIEAIATDVEGSYLFGGLAPGTWYVAASDPVLIREIWDGNYCPFSCDVTAVGDPIAVTGGLIGGIDFDLEAGGAILGVVTDEQSGSRLQSILVGAYDGAGQEIRFDVTDQIGRYELPFLRAGSYTVRASSQRHLAELFDDVPCPEPCDVTGGTPVQVAPGSARGGVDFQLEELVLGSISGTVASGRDQTPAAGTVGVYDTSASIVGASSIQADGTYRVEGLLSGDHFAQTFSAGFLDELYDDVPCEGSCNLFAGTPIAVILGQDTAGIDFELDELGVITGKATEVGGGPVSVNLRLYHENGQFRAANASNFEGIYRFVGLHPGQYVVQTVSGFYEDVLFDDIGCSPSCDVTVGDPISVVANSTTAGIDLTLIRCSASSHLVLDDFLVSDRRVEEACRTIRLGQGVVATDGELVLRAGRAVVFESGFAVAAGGRLEVTVDPAVLSP